MIDRRDFLKLSAAVGAGLVLPSVKSGKLAGVRSALADPAVPGIGLSDPANQPLFEVEAPNALDPGFIYAPTGGRSHYRVGVAKNANHMTGLENGDGPVPTRVWGYGQGGEATWPGKTFEVWKGRPIQVRWENNLFGEPHLLPVDTNVHWAYSLHGYENYTIGSDGVPIVAHLHGGHTLDNYDGNPEQFFSPGYKIRGPHWRGKTYIYQNDQDPGTLWYHDHALGITRLNVYAGLAGFYIIRDDFDTGKPGNPAGLPAWPYELAYAIQDRMFYDDGRLFYPAFPGDPFYEGFITDEGAVLPPDLFPGGGPTALAEFFGDHMVVNGKIWPYAEVEPRNYRMRLLNGTDSRFLAIQFFEVPAGTGDEADWFDEVMQQLDFTVVGSDQGLVANPSPGRQTLLIEPGSRYDIVIDFSQVTPGNRVIMKNIGGDEPFGGTLTTEDPALQVFERTDRIMAFDVVVPLNNGVLDVTPMTGYTGPIVAGGVDRVRKLGLFEGKDEFGRLQPLLGTAEPATDFAGNPINWPSTPEYASVDLVGQMEGSVGWHSPTTENPALNTTEEWEVWNVTGDAHLVHLHLVHFEIAGRKAIKWDSHTIGPDDPEYEEDRVIPNAKYDWPEGDGTYLVTQPVVQHNSVAGDMSTYGTGFKIMNKTYGPPVPQPAEYVEDAPKDMVTALPGQITTIRARFDRPGRYVWHCHILSHEDHEMMRVLHVGGGA